MEALTLFARIVETNNIDGRLYSENVTTFLLYVVFIHVCYILPRVLLCPIPIGLK